MLIVAWRSAVAPRAAVVALSLVGALTGESAPVYESVTTPKAPLHRVAKAPRAAVRNLYGNIALSPGSTVVPPEVYGTTALLVVEWPTKRAPRAAAANLYRNTIPGPESAPPPEPESISRIARAPAGWNRRTPRAITANLYGNQGLQPADGPAPAAPVAGDATAHLVVGWTPPRAPRAAFLLAQQPALNPADGPAPPVVVESAGSVPRVPRGGWSRRAPSAAIAAAYRWQAGDELEPYGDATAITVVGWRAQRTRRAHLIHTLGGQVPGDLTTAAVIEPEGASQRLVTWPARKTPRAVTAILYGNIALEPSSTAPVIIPESAGGTAAAPKGWTRRAPRAVTANLYGNAALEIPLVPGLPQAVSALPLGRYRPFRWAPRAVVAVLYRNVSPFNGDGPVVVETPPTVFIDFYAPAPALTFAGEAIALSFTATAPDLAWEAEAPDLTFAAPRPDLEFDGGG